MAGIRRVRIPRYYNLDNIGGGRPCSAPRNGYYAREWMLVADPPHHPPRSTHAEGVHGRDGLGRGGDGHHGRQQAKAAAATRCYAQYSKVERIIERKAGVRLSMTYGPVHRSYLLVLPPLSERSR